VYVQEFLHPQQKYGFFFWGTRTDEDAKIREDIPPFRQFAGLGKVDY